MINWEHVKYFIFFGALSVVFIIYSLIYLSFLFGYSPITVWTFKIIVNTAPLIIHDLSLFGEITPPLLAGIMATSAPPRTKNIPFILAVGFSLIGYILYLHLTVFVDSKSGETLIGLATLSNETGTLTSFIGGIRTFCIIVVAALIGLKLNKIAT